MPITELEASATGCPAVGDPVVTRWYRGHPWNAVDRQLEDITLQIQRAGGRLVRTAADIRAAHGGPPVALLGVEGADAIGHDVDGLDRWRDRAVRVVTIVHLADNQIGTTSLPWQRYVGPLPVRRRVDEGLSPFGGRVVDRMNALGMVIDLAHADARTLLDVVDRTTAPVVATHSGARARQDFPRFLTDAEVRAIAGTGGAVGLWPYHYRGKGARDIADLVAHARHVAGLVGPQHVGQRAVTLGRGEQSTGIGRHQPAPAGPGGEDPRARPAPGKRGAGCAGAPGAGQPAAEHGEVELRGLGHPEPGGVLEQARDVSGVGADGVRRPGELQREVALEALQRRLQRRGQRSLLARSPLDGHPSTVSALVLPGQAAEPSPGLRLRRLPRAQRREPPALGGALDEPVGLQRRHHLLDDER